jgi:hypothetical protein
VRTISDFSPAPGRSRAGALGVGAVSLALAVWAFAYSSSAGAATDGEGLSPSVPAFTANTFTFNGALTGTLHVQPRYDCKGAGPAGVTLNVPGQLGGSRSGQWVIQVVSLNNGTYALRASSVIGVTVSDASGAQQWGLNPKGWLTVNGTSGTVTAGLSGTDGSWVHVTGAWSCPTG